ECVTASRARGVAIVSACAVASGCVNSVTRTSPRAAATVFPRGTRGPAAAQALPRAADRSTVRAIDACGLPEGKETHGHDRSACTVLAARPAELARRSGAPARTRLLRRRLARDLHARDHEG